MAKLLHAWLKSDLSDAFEELVAWKREQIISKTAPQVKKEPGSDEYEIDGEDEDDSDGRFFDNDSNMGIELTRPTTVKSWVQIVKVCLLRTLIG